MWHFGAKEGRLRESDLVDRVSAQPAEILGLHSRKGTLAQGSDAGTVIFDPELPVTITPEVMHGRADHSPYEGLTARGWPVSTVVRSRWAVKGRELIGRRGHGCFIERANACRRPGVR